jgi:hypothetical protein
VHFSQLHSSVASTLEGVESERALLHIQMQGFLDTTMLAEHVDALELRLADARSPLLVLCDLRGVSGYGDGTSSLAREWLRRLELADVRRVALVAGSSVLRTAVRMVASGLSMQLRCFTSVDAAMRWLRVELSRPADPTTRSLAEQAATD